jgi:ribulose-5-phosphate 4-epimerase/fuculose-1-phosphate aldolase
MDEAKLRREMLRVGASLFGRGYVHATAGNISVKLDDGGFLITPTDSCLGFLDSDRLSRVDASGNHAGGDRPSKTLVLHKRIYAADPAARCVIHTHSTHLVALTLAGPWKDEELLPPVTPYFVMKVGHVPLIPYHRPGDARVGDLVADAIARFAARGAPIRAVMLDRLGPNVWHDSPANAMAVLEELEETAKLWMLMGYRAQPLSEPQIEELRRAFGAKW